jgi:hypothetical protein
MRRIAGGDQIGAGAKALPWHSTKRRQGRVVQARLFNCGAARLTGRRMTRP